MPKYSAHGGIEVLKALEQGWYKMLAANISRQPVVIELDLPDFNRLQFAVEQDLPYYSAFQKSFTPTVDAEGRPLSFSCHHVTVRCRYPEEPAAAPKRTRNKAEAA